MLFAFYFIVDHIFFRLHLDEELRTDFRYLRDLFSLLIKRFTLVDGYVLGADSRLVFVRFSTRFFLFF